ncbi:MAG: DUF2796 domain-containing protein [Nitrosomonas sp.]|nr:DUF2796 domain-containing protein [Nitrosomonas sp.]
MKINRVSVPQLLLGLLGWLFSSANLNADTHHAHGAHVHGEAELYIVHEHGKLFIEFISPAINLIDFEHPPKSEQQQNILTHTKQILVEGDQLFQITPFNCQLETATASAPYIDGAPSAEHFHSGGEHPDFHASYVFNCQANTKLTTIYTALIVKFPGIERIKVQWIVQNQQGSTQLTTDRATLSFN